LETLWLGRNKISKLENLHCLTHLRLLSIQSNRITKLEGLSSLPNLEELYVSHNGLTKIEGLENNVRMRIPIEIPDGYGLQTKLTTLDVARNKIERIENVSHLVLLQDLWCNGNLISDWNDVQSLAPATKLQTVYLEHNPIAKDVNYRRKLKLMLPSLTQIDATYIR